jgi:hypothetical protein
VAATLRVSGGFLLETRNGIVDRLVQLYTLRADSQRTVRETNFVTNEDGQIVGKREVVRSEADTAPLMPILSDAELVICADVPYATQVAAGVLAFDWAPVERAVGRGLSSLDLRVLREGAVRSAEADVDWRLAALVASIEGAGG